MKNDERDRWISDSSLSAYLLAKGFRLKQTQSNAGRVSWLFGAVPESTVFSYYNDDPAPAKSLLTALRELKAMVHQEL